MYNGVGLTSVRGSATNGYVQRNLAHQKPKTKIDYNKEMEKAMAKPSLGRRLALGRARARARTEGGRAPAQARNPAACLCPCAHRCWRGLCVWWLSPSRDPVRAARGLS